MNEPMSQPMSQQRTLVYEDIMSQRKVRSARSALHELDRMLEPRYILTQGVLERIAVDLPRALREGPDNILQLVVRFCGKTFEVLYVGLDGTESVWPHRQTLEGFDPIAMVGNFSENFGWVENLQLEHEKTLLSGQREQLRHIVEDISTIQTHLPRKLYLSGSGRLCKRPPKGGGFSMSLRIDVVLSTISYWLAYYQVDDDNQEGTQLVARFGVFFNEKTLPPPLEYWHTHRLTGPDLIAYMLCAYGVDLQKKPR